MHNQVKMKNCRDVDCDNSFPQYNSLQKYCSYECKKKNIKPSVKKIQKPIPKFSPKRKIENAIYLKKRTEFLNKPEHKICFIDGCEESSTTVEHRAGRIGKNYLDESTWAGCCLRHNLELENNPILSKHYQLSKIHDGKKI